MIYFILFTFSLLIRTIPNNWFVKFLKTKISSCKLSWDGFGRLCSNFWTKREILHSGTELGLLPPSHRWPKWVLILGLWLRARPALHQLGFWLIDQIHSALACLQSMLAVEEEAPLQSLTGRIQISFLLSAFPKLVPFVPFLWIIPQTLSFITRPLNGVFEQQCCVWHFHAKEAIWTIGYPQELGLFFPTWYQLSVFKRNMYFSNASLYQKISTPAL